jgi:acetyl-CoA carboxylase biotin carboxyl carrier protein
VTDVDGGPAGDLLAVQECVLQLVRELPDQPQRLRLSVAGVAIEIDWPERSGRITAVTASPAGPDEEVIRAEAELPAVGSGANLVCSPSVGTFYRAPEPGAPPFVAEGDLVQAGQQVAIVEAMKLMLPVEASQPGRVAKFLRGDGDPVEYGEPLLSLDSSGGAAG